MRGDKKARRVVKRARWLLLRNAENLQGHDERIRLRELLAANRALLVVHLLKDDLKHLWTYRYAALPCESGKAGTTVPCEAESSHSNALHGG
jgi:transposase